MDDPKAMPSRAGDDPLGQQLRRAAMEERPAFSPGLHRQIAARIGAEGRPDRSRLRIGLWPAAAAAAAIILLASALLLYRSVSSSRDRMKPTALGPRTAPDDNRSHARANAIDPILALGNGGAGDPDGGNLISARLWPPALVVRLPIRIPLEPSSIASESPPKPPAVLSLPGSPRWLLSSLQAPEDRAVSSVTQVIPQPLRPLFQGQHSDVQ